MFATRGLFEKESNQVSKTIVDSKYFNSSVISKRDRCVVVACALPVHSGDCIFYSDDPSGFHTSWKPRTKSKLSNYQKNLIMDLGITPKKSKSLKEKTK